MALRFPVAVATTELGAVGVGLGAAAVNGEKLVVTPQTWPLK